MSEYAFTGRGGVTAVQLYAGALVGVSDRSLRIRMRLVIGSDSLSGEPTSWLLKPAVPLLQALPLAPASVHEPGISPDLDEPFRRGVRLPPPELVDILGEEPDDEPGLLAIGGSQQEPHIGGLSGFAPLDDLAGQQGAIRLLRDEAGLGDRVRLPGVDRGHVGEPVLGQGLRRVSLHVGIRADRDQIGIGQQFGDDRTLPGAVLVIDIDLEGEEDRKLRVLGLQRLVDPLRQDLKLLRTFGCWPPPTC